MAPKRPLVHIESLSKHYGEFVALTDFALDVMPGEIVALVGPNGAGKTTALKVMVGLLSPTTGHVLIDHVDVHRHPSEANRGFSFIPDQPFVYEQLTLAEFLAFVGAMYQLSAEALKQRADLLVRLFGLEPWMSDRLSQLSYGMKSRVVLVASLLHNPSALIMDEPFFGLDPQTLRLVKRLLLERVREGMAVILSTHQLDIVEDVASRIAVMTQGRLVALGTLEELKRQYGDGRLEELFFHLTESGPAPQGAS